MSVGKGFVQYYKVLQTCTKVVTSIVNLFKHIIMKTKILLFALSAAALGGCSTAYKSTQTPDDVYYSPVRPVEEKSEKDRDEVRNEPEKDYQISMAVRDHRWRDFRDDYDFDNSPYNYTCKRYNYGYYYNPRYYPWAIYTGKPSYSKPVNSTPRMVNLNAYKGYNPNVAISKTTGTVNTNSSYRYNNSNNSENSGRKLILPSSNSSSSNNTRTYTPSSNSNSGSSSSGNSNSGSVSRPKRGG